MVLAARWGDTCVWCQHDSTIGRHGVSTGPYTVCCYDQDGRPLVPAYYVAYRYGDKEPHCDIHNGPLRECAEFHG